MRFLSTIFLFSFLMLSVHAQLKLPRVFSDGMVIQREEQVKMWGWARPGANVKIEFRGKTYRTTAKGSGEWSVKLKTGKAGGPFSLNIRSENDAKTLSNVLVGDVWLCAGQSNMVHAFNRYTTIYPDEIAQSTNTKIRQFAVPTTTDLVDPQQELAGGQWQEANPANLLDFTVVGYFLAKTIYDQYQIPIGIINTSVGGTPIEAWISEGGFQDFEDILAKIEQNKDTASINQINRIASDARKEAWANQPVDLGLLEGQEWFNPEYEPANWKRMNIPGYWEDQGIRNLDGIVWFRKKIELPNSFAGKEAFLEMGRIVDADEIYLNGIKIGQTGYQYPPRRYAVPKGVLQAGSNTVAIRVTNHYGKGGFVPDKPYYLEVDGQIIDLKGYWSYKVGAVFERHNTNSPKSVSLQNQPTALYNAMVAPLSGYKLKGMCWYQGESNAGNPEKYRKLLPALISDWRNLWSQPDLPAVVIQLPNFMEVNYSPEESNWAQMRAAQQEILSMSNTGLVVTIDLGEWNDIHPMQKKPVGHRAGLVARKLVYGEQNLVSSGPQISSAQRDGSKVLLTFEETGSGLTTHNNEPPSHLAIAGADRRFYWAEAKIQGDQVLLWCDEVDQPKYVRYAWADNPDFANLYNEEGLPASPFEIKVGE